MPLIKPVRCVETGKIYRSEVAAAQFIGVATNTLANHLDSGQWYVNGLTYEHFHVPVTKTDAERAEILKMQNQVEFPPEIQIGDYVISKGDRVLVYGSLESLTTRCDLEQANIPHLAKNGLRDKLGRRVTFIDSEETLQTVCGGDRDWVELVRARERNKIRIGGLR